MGHPQHRKGNLREVRAIRSNPLAAALFRRLAGVDGIRGGCDRLLIMIGEDSNVAQIAADAEFAVVPVAGQPACPQRRSSRSIPPVPTPRSLVRLTMVWEVERGERRLVVRCLLESFRSSAATTPRSVSSEEVAFV